MLFLICGLPSNEKEVLSETIHLYCENKYINHEIIPILDNENILLKYKSLEVPPDIIYIDTGFHPFGGINTCKRLRQLGYSGDIVLLSHWHDDALLGYEVDARAFLIYPCNPNKIFVDLNRLINHPIHKAIMVKDDGCILRLPISEITYIKSDNKKCIISTFDGKEYTETNKLNILEQDIHDEHFLRCSYSFLVNMDYIVRIDEDFIVRDKHGKESVVVITRKKYRIMLNLYNEYRKKCYSYSWIKDMPKEIPNMGSTRRLPSEG